MAFVIQIIEKIRYYVSRHTRQPHFHERASLKKVSRDETVYYYRYS